MTLQFVTYEEKVTEFRGQGGGISKKKQIVIKVSWRSVHAICLHLESDWFSRDPSAYSQSIIGQLQISLLTPRVLLVECRAFSSTLDPYVNYPDQVRPGCNDPVAS